MRGPGTGKTHTFKEVAKKIGKDKKVLVFTLINNLASELAKDFESSGVENTETRTFHGYCKKLLYKKFGFRGNFYPDLPVLIESDARFLNFGFTRNDFHKAFANLESAAPSLKFFLDRTKYYETLGYDSSVYEVYNRFRSDNGTIPSYDLVIADEYQDFNKLEASFIELLTKKSPILVAGDDDQALYGFRHASKDHIRDLYKNPQFEKFNLPFSSRCTSVLVESVNSLIKSSKDILGGRIEEKDYISYWPDKYLFDKTYPQIEVVHCSLPRTASLHIKTKIENLAKREKLSGSEEEIQFLIVGSRTQHRLNMLAKYLEDSLDPKLFSVEVKEDEGKTSIEGGFLEIYKDKESNLGWRIILENDPPKKIKEIIKRSYKKDLPLFNIIPQSYKEKYLSKAGDYFSKTDSQSDQHIEEAANKRIRVKLTTHLGAKGLSALHVIVQEFHNGVLPNDKTGKSISDEDICKLIVSLTRAKRSCSLVTFKEYDRSIGKLADRSSKLLDMLPKKSLKELTCRIKEKALIYSN